MSESNSKQGRVRYAVVGLGHIAQVAVLPAFANAENAELTALVSNDRYKLQELGKRYKVPRTYTYDHYEECLRSGEIDAVFIALPNDMHRKYTVQAAAAGVHVLCEKPMAVTRQECAEMIAACEKNSVKLMIAYRLHFEEANLKAVELAHSGKLGDLRVFNSTFSMQVKPGNIRVDASKGGGTVYDIGVYCINAARYIFRDEPTEVTAFSVSGQDPRFQEVDEMTSAVLKFPQDRLAAFTSSFGAADAGSYTVLGTKGTLQLDPAFEYAAALKQVTTIGGKKEEQSFSKRDQFAAELIYFSQCIQTNRNPEPDGYEGMADVQIIEAIYESARTQQPVKLDLPRKAERPGMKQEIHRPPVEKPEEIHAEAPTQE